MHMAASPLVQENTGTIVSFSHRSGGQFGHSCPQIHDGLSSYIHRNCGSNFIALIEVALKFCSNFLELRITKPVQSCRRHIVLRRF